MIQEKYTFELEASALLAILEYEYSSVEGVIEDILAQVKPEEVTRKEFVKALEEKVQELWEKE